MAIHPDVMFYLLFESIRGDWSEGVGHRILAMESIIDETSFADKDGMKQHLKDILNAWTDENEHFDGRHWARDGKFCYYKLFNNFDTIENFKSTNYLHWGTSDDGSTRLESNPRNIITCNEDVMDLYYRMQDDGV